MNKEQLLENMNRLGIPLMVPEKAVDVEATLAQVILSHDPRLWEVFPGLLANIVEKHPVDLQAVADRLPLSSDKEALYRLCALAQALYGAYHVPFAELNKAFHELTAPDAAAQKALRRALAQDTNIPLAGEVLAAQRVKNSFESYLSYKNMQQEKLSAKFKEMSMEYALSQIFPAKQKELFKKRLNREKMTKTEREYYYRVVKKKAQALANPELHRMAQKIMDL